MSVASTCDICRAGAVEHTCDRCGNLVCERHFDETTGFCAECVTGVDGGSDTSQPDYTDTYRM
jgi:hypothetical protein